MEIRVAVPEDAEAIRTIYNAEVSGSTVTFDLVERTPAEQRAFMAEHSGVYPLLVAVEDDAVVAFASLSPYRTRPGYSTTAEDSIYVSSDRRGSGIGKLLLSALLDEARLHGFHSVIGRIVGEHPASVALHRSCGFEVVGVEKEVGRKFGRWLDVCLMQVLL
jgi:L-amino acid N-acyltransferase